MNHGSTLPPKRFDVEQALKIIGIFFTGFALLLTFLTFKNSQKWKEAEFLALQFKQFSSSDAARVINQCLDYNRTTLVVDGDTIEITDAYLTEEVLVLDSVSPYFSAESVKLRNLLDIYLDQFAVLNRYLESDLIQKDQVTPYIQYQISIIADTSNKKKSTEFRNQLWDYIDYYNFYDVQELCKKFGYDIAPKKE